MKRRTFTIAVLGALALTVFGGCGGADNKLDGNQIKIIMGSAPDSLDPSMGVTTEFISATNNVYIPLLTYRHVGGAKGTELIPGLAQALPNISKDGKTYTLRLRKNLRYSNDKPVKVSDVKFAIERAIKLNWPNKSYFTKNVVGAADFDAGKAKSISGITTNDSTGDITIKLLGAYGPFSDVLAYQTTSPLPKNTPMEPLIGKRLPPSIGAYRISDEVINRSFTLTRVPEFAKFKIPGIPTGFVDRINVEINSNPNSQAQLVLSNDADVFHSGDTLPASLTTLIEERARNRFATQPLPYMFYFFLNTKLPPFDNLKARQAVSYAFDRSAIVRLSGGFIEPACHFIPKGITGSTDAPCAYGSLTGSNLEKARQLVKEAGVKGQRVTVYGQKRGVRDSYSEYLASVLDSIGFKTRIQLLTSSIYFQTVGSQNTKAQTGFGSWLQDFPNPANFYLNLDGENIAATNNPNFSNVNDPHVQKELAYLTKVPTAKLGEVADRWRALDRYVAEKAYLLPIGTQSSPQFFSDRIDIDSAVFHLVFQNDWSTLRLK